VKKLALETFGVYRVQVDGEEFKSFRFVAKIKPPKRKWEKVDVRDGVAPAMDPLELGRTGDREPSVLVRGQDGAANRYFFTPGRTGINEYLNDAPDGLSFDTVDPVRVEGWLVSYRRVSSTGTFEALVSEIVRDEDGVIESFRVEIKTPDGDGVSVFDAITRDGAGMVTGYREVRTYGEEGVDPTFTLVLSAIERLSGQGQVRYRVEYTGGGTGPTTYLYPPWQLAD
jgi:hypothetical protein